MFLQEGSLLSYLISFLYFEYFPCFHPLLVPLISFPPHYASKVFFDFLFCKNEETFSWFARKKLQTTASMQKDANNKLHKVWELAQFKQETFQILFRSLIFSFVPPTWKINFLHFPISHSEKEKKRKKNR